MPLNKIKNNIILTNKKREKCDEEYLKTLSLIEQEQYLSKRGFCYKREYKKAKANTEKEKKQVLLSVSKNHYLYLLKNNIERLEKLEHDYSKAKLLKIDIDVTWKASRIWGDNPTADVRVLYLDENGYRRYCRFWNS